MTIRRMTYYFFSQRQADVCGTTFLAGWKDECPNSAIINGKRVSYTECSGSDYLHMFDNDRLEQGIHDYEYLGNTHGVGHIIINDWVTWNKEKERRRRMKENKGSSNLSLSAIYFLTTQSKSVILFNMR